MVLGPCLNSEPFEALGVVEHHLADLEGALPRDGGDARREDVQARQEVQVLGGALHVGLGGGEGLGEQVGQGREGRLARGEALGHGGATRVGDGQRRNTPRREAQGEAVEDRELVEEGLGRRHGHLGAAAQRDDHVALLLREGGVDVVDQGDAADVEPRGHHLVDHVDEVFGLAALADGHEEVAVAERLGALPAKLPGENGNELGPGDLVEEERRRLRRVKRRAATHDVDAPAPREAVHGHREETLHRGGELVHLRGLQHRVEEAHREQVAPVARHGQEIGEKTCLRRGQRVAEL